MSALLRRPGRIRLGLMMGGVLAAAGGMAWAQQSGSAPAGAGTPTRASEDAGPVGAALTFGLSQGLAYEENPNLSANAPGRPAVVARTLFDIGFESQTRNSILGIGFNGTFDAGDMPEERSGSQLKSYGSRLSYEREGPNSALSFSASASRSPHTSNSTLPEDFTSDDLRAEGGDRVNNRLGFSLRRGIAGPVGFDLSGRYSEVSYEDGTDLPEDRVNQGLDGQLRLQMNPAMALLLTAGYSSETRDDEEDYDSETAFAGVGLSYELGAATRLRVDLRQTDIETTRTDLGTGDRTTEDEGGPGIIVNVEHDRPNGSMGLGFSSLPFETSRRDTLTLSRSLELPLGGISLSLGATQSDSGLNPAVTLSYEREGKYSVVGASLSQTVAGDADSEVLRSQLSLDWSREMSAVSVLSAGISVSDSDPTGNDSDTSAIRRTDLSVGYDHDLTEAWALSTSYSHQIRDEDGEDRRTNDVVFLGLQRTFEKRLR